MSVRLWAATQRRRTSACENPLEVDEAWCVGGGIEITPLCGLVPARPVTVTRIVAAGRGSQSRMRSTAKRFARAFRSMDREDRSAWPMTRLILVEKGACRATSENACFMTSARVSLARGRGRTRRLDPTFWIQAFDRLPRKSSLAILPMWASAPKAPVGASGRFGSLCAGRSGGRSTFGKRQRLSSLGRRAVRRRRF